MTGPQRKTKFTPVHITPDARDLLQQLQLEQSAEVGQRLTITRTVLALVALGRRHMSELEELADKNLTPDDILKQLASRNQEGTE